MMPLTLANMGEENLIHRVGGSPEVKKHLEDLGFVAGGTVTVAVSYTHLDVYKRQGPGRSSSPGTRSRTPW